MKSHLQQCITQFSYIWYIKCNPNYYITPKRKPSVLPEYWFSSWNVLSANPTLQVLMRVVLDLPSLDGKMISCWIHHLVEVMYQPNPQFCQVSIQWTWLMCVLSLKQESYCPALPGCYEVLYWQQSSAGYALVGRQRFFYSIRIYLVYLKYSL